MERDQDGRKEQQIKNSNKPQTSIFIKLVWDKVNSHWDEQLFDMFSEYMTVALEKAQYKVIEDEYPYFAEVPELEGVWATGKTIRRLPQGAHRGNRRVDCSQATKRIIYSLP
jgi:hypothetical protein